MGEIDLAALPRPAVRYQRGAASELTACTALMLAGYYVYRCEAPHAPFDVVAYRDGKCYRVEVKSVAPSTDSRWAPCLSWPKNDEWDLLVVVGEDRVFCFDSSTSKDGAVEVIRAHYGFAPKPQPGERTCKCCDMAFISPVPTARFCSDRCRSRWVRQRTEPQTGGAA